jgi:Bacterial-like globin
MQSVHEAAGGSAGLLRLAEAWHSRVMADEIVSHAFSHRFHPQHSERLAAYWAEALGGPAIYSATYGDESDEPPSARADQTVVIGGLDTRGENVVRVPVQVLSAGLWCADRRAGRRSGRPASPPQHRA